MCEKNRFLMNIWFSAYLFHQIKIETFLKISANFYNDWRWHHSVSVYQPNINPSNSPWNSLQQFFLLIKKLSFSHTTDVMNHYFPGFDFLEFLVNALSVTSHIFISIILSYFAASTLNFVTMVQSTSYTKQYNRTSYTEQTNITIIKNIQNLK